MTKRRKLAVFIMTAILAAMVAGCSAPQSQEETSETTQQEEENISEFFTNRDLVIKLEGAKKMYSLLGEDFHDPGVKIYEERVTDEINSAGEHEIESTVRDDLLSEVSYEGEIDKNTLGEYELLYTVPGGRLLEKREVEVVDFDFEGTNEEFSMLCADLVNKEDSYDYFVIKANGPEIMFSKAGEKFCAPGFTIYQKNQKDPKHQIVRDDLRKLVNVEAEIDNNTPGDYEISYQLFHRGVTAYQTVRVVETNFSGTNQEFSKLCIPLADKDKHFYLQSEKEIYLEVGEEYVVPVIEVYERQGYDDILRKDLMPLVSITGEVDTSIPGTYKVEYSFPSYPVNLQSTITVFVGNAYREKLNPPIDPEELFSDNPKDMGKNDNSYNQSIDPEERRKQTGNDGAGSSSDHEG